ncbi:hypothetical protein [Cesiribacter andamanensis]|uniref:Uncharacterized protein n=1 Tax=Cesiribacter andamanensis AMV16 TaxID=1279009 RepID=M7NIG1_9BACT|nr:hypothetical protein [Cesiribacter andamanensis]EMR01580.1 hypothetical protein ADICEAN_03285 [Cesiribacter andamanensis AMV16]
MQDFLNVFLLLALVLLAILAFIFLADLLGVWGLALLEILITVGIILLAIRFIRPHNRS